MSWFKVDDGFYSHEKVVRIPREVRAEAAGTWTLCGTWSADKDRDGFVPAHMIDELGGTVRGAEALVKVGMWKTRRGGFAFVNWAEFQPTVTSKLEKKKADAERQAAYRAKKAAEAAERAGVSQRDMNGVTTESVPPVPVPVPERRDTPQTPHGGKRGQRLNPDWTPPGTLIAHMRTECPDVDLKHEHTVFVDYWIAQPGQKGVKADWEATWRNWMRRKQDDLRKGIRQTPEQRARTTLALATDIDTKEISA